MLCISHSLHSTRPCRSEAGVLSAECEQRHRIRHHRSLFRDQAKTSILFEACAKTRLLVLDRKHPLGRLPFSLNTISTGLSPPCTRPPHESQAASPRAPHARRAEAHAAFSARPAGRRDLKPKASGAGFHLDNQAE